MICVVPAKAGPGPFLASDSDTAPTSLKGSKILWDGPTSGSEVMYANLPGDDVSEVRRDSSESALESDARIGA